MQYPGAGAGAARRPQPALADGAAVRRRSSPGLDVKPLLAELKERVAEELDYLLEADVRSGRSRAAYDGDPRLRRAARAGRARRWCWSASGSTGYPLSPVIADGTPGAARPLRQPRTCGSCSPGPAAGRAAARRPAPGQLPAAARRPARRRSTSARSPGCPAAARRRSGGCCRSRCAGDADGGARRAARARASSSRRRARRRAAARLPGPVRRAGASERVHVQPGRGCASSSPGSTTPRGPTTRWG